MSIGQYKNSIKNLIERYIPEKYEGKEESIVYIAPGQEWTLVFEDPSGVLDIWGWTSSEDGYELDIYDEDFNTFLTYMASQVIGDPKDYMMGGPSIRLRWHQNGPPHPVRSRFRHCR